MPVTICDHPMIRQALGELRRKETPPLEFRERVGELARYLSYEAARDLALAAVEIETPVQKTIAHRVAEERIILAPILRAGLAMIEGAMATFPHAQVRHIGIFRDEKTALPVEYYVKLPPRLDPETLVIILDPMLATGGSACMAIDAFAKRGITRFKFVCLIAAPEGVAAVQACHPAVPIYTASVDERLNERKFIVPGLGDAGDRCFGTT
ncbi:MAG TPA: uracil phosphoribosyltransferase [Phycisphaerae bacterium]|jgi:uracil phosphoribosyltransferase|nr:uracil phosphoribosyltransferase [Phycisphaerae bacterium]